MTAFLWSSSYYLLQLVMILSSIDLCFSRRALLQIPETNITLPRGDWGMAIGYSATSNLIWLLGGLVYSKQKVSFNPDRLYWNDAITDYTTNAIANNIYFRGQGYTQKNDILYMLDTAGTTFITFNLSSQELMYNWKGVSLPIAVGNGACLAIICTDYLVVVGGKNSNTFLNIIQIYNINTNVWLNNVNLPQMTVARDRATCQITSDNSHLYVMGGRKNDNEPGGWIDSIEKLPIGNMNCIHQQQFHLSNAVLLDPKMQLRSFIYSNNIYIVGGTYWTNQKQSTNKVGVLDTYTDTITKLDNLRRNTANAAVIIVGHSFYVLGAYLQTWATPTQPKIMYHHFNITQFVPLPSDNCPIWPSTQTCSPTAPPPSITSIPSFHPSFNPSQTSIDTSDPSFNPSFNPSTYPSNYPSFNPTRQGEAVIDETDETQILEEDGLHDVYNSEDNSLVIYVVAGVLVFLCFMIFAIICFIRITKKNYEDPLSKKYVPGAINVGTSVVSDKDTPNIIKDTTVMTMESVPGSSPSINTTGVFDFMNSNENVTNTEMISFGGTTVVGTEGQDIDTNTVSNELEHILKSNGIFSDELYEKLVTNKIDVDTLRNDVKQNEIDELCDEFDIGYKNKLNLRKLWRIVNETEGGVTADITSIQPVVVPSKPGMDENVNEESMIVIGDDELVEHINGEYVTPYAN